MNIQSSQMARKVVDEPRVGLGLGIYSPPWQLVFLKL